MAFSSKIHFPIPSSVSQMTLFPDTSTTQFTFLGNFPIHQCPECSMAPSAGASASRVVEGSKVPKLNLSSYVHCVPINSVKNGIICIGK